ncbi:lanthionine synthetase C family protein [Cryomorpha ignava]|uniref:Lanthionine synthetase C family protein n=1 Tax=Cryomorpha ignava TaxID=101383 RepID=A0A7K3WRW6_9FLAO|nr:lanthionine synthetase C family protein [Cryomorpha ignava]NEN23801.1 lanthionine synthetase C family protein [Cryomorpha ignava]
MTSRVIEKITEIDIILRKTLITNSKSDNSNYRMGFLTGEPGISLFYYLNYLRTRDVENIALLECAIEKSFSILNNTLKLNSFHCNGISGFMSGLMLIHRGNIIDLKDLLHYFSFNTDNYLTSSFNKALNGKNFDFLHGAEGILNYFLLQNKAENKVADYINVLDNTKIVIPKKGVAWKSNLLIDKKRSGVYNLGLAHGMASTIIILSKIIEGYGNLKAQQLLERNLEFYFSEELSMEYSASFPNLSSLDEPPKNSRLGWCYGDLGISIALWYAGRALKNESIKKKAISVCEKTLVRKDYPLTGIKDAGLCHGTAGIAAIYSRMYILTGKLEFRVAYEYWILETLNFAQEDIKNAGYKSWTTEGGIYETNVLSGIAGIGIALNQYIHEIDTSWDNCLLLS